MRRDSKRVCRCIKRIDRGDDGLVGHDDSGDQQSVLIGVVELLESPEDVPFASFVWLNSGDVVYRVLPRDL